MQQLPDRDSDLTNQIIVLEVNVGLDPKTSLLLGGVIQVMFVIGKKSTKHVHPASKNDELTIPTIRILLSNLLLRSPWPQEANDVGLFRTFHLHDDDLHSSLFQRLASPQP
jgi:hypothetical protein